jgi:anti-sigma regulatory factor (Ser/Thr protein kinase)
MTVKTQNTPTNLSYNVSIPPRSSGAELHAAIADLTANPADEVRLMSGSLQFVTPREVCGLRALLDHAAANAAHVYFDCPADPNVHAYLERIDFYKDLPENVTLSRPVRPSRRRDRWERLIELLSIHTSEDVARLSSRVSAVAAAQLGSGPVAAALATGIAAATENVIDHANSPIGALIAAQRYEGKGLELAVVDLGAGIPTTLGRNPDHMGLRDLEAVERALEDGVSSTGEAGRGAGLPDFVNRVSRGGNATLGIASGCADLRLSWQAGRHTQNATTPMHPVPGTWIWLRLRA